ncbi:E3 ubiquitin-protein ligase MSL2 [Anoplophora glabripennis]|uniref:E3 ubiquitin-protein ligase MSL2 n=1 Tax=Anoplophora glabripennis TaxID=217634 RepID=UPI0008735663|nr:E3 ubiquitin-protein ligase MSL2 [Anoplophora glabripennis]
MNSKEKPPIPVPKMNATNLYATTTQIVMKSDPKNPNSWQDLYRLVPYLRNSLCCVVCSNLLVDPLTPTIAQCQHHLCRPCKGGRKKIKPACEGCKECKDYTENKRLRILLQCYKKMCVWLIHSPLFKSITMQASQPGTGFERGASNLIMLIKEGAAFQDDYKSNGGLPKSAYSILPCIYTNSANTQGVHSQVGKDNKNLVLNSNMQNRTSFYSVLYPGNGSKITLKRKQKDSLGNSKSGTNRQREYAEKAVFKKPCTVKPKKGCRCGNATATPGKLTCCGQRCPCYVDSKPCLECKCRGCRNPHRMDGQKVMPHIPELQQIQLVQSTPPPVLSQDVQSVKIEGIDLETQFTAFDSMNMNQHFKTYKLVNGGYNTMPLTTDLLPIDFNEDEDTEITVV